MRHWQNIRYLNIRYTETIDFVVSGLAQCNQLTTQLVGVGLVMLRNKPGCSLVEIGNDGIDAVHTGARHQAEI